MSSNDQLDHETMLIMMFREKGVEPTGRKEVTGMKDVDHALANWLAMRLKGVIVTEETKDNRAFARFIERPSRDQVLVGHFEDLRDMVRSIRQAKAGRPSQHENPFANPDALPIINITRTMDFQYGYAERQLDRSDYGELRNDAGAIEFVLAALPVQLIYTLTIAGGDKETVAMLCNLLMGQFYALHSTAFAANTRICGADVELECALNNMKGGMVSDVSLPVTEDRLFAAQITMDVLADSITAHEVKPTTRKYQVGIRPMNEHLFPRGGQ